MPNMSLLQGNTIEIHYFFNDRSHTMDAIIFNKSELEFLGIAQEILTKLQINADIEIAPLEEGGLRSWLNFKADKKDSLKIAIVTALLTSFVVTPISTTLEYISNKVLNLIFEDPEIQELRLQKEKAILQLEIAKIQSQTKKLCNKIDENKIQKKRSNFYEQINTCSKIQQISIAITDDKRTNYLIKEDVYRTDFQKYIMTSDEIEPDIDEHAIIDIISPVLKKGRYKWTGVYRGEVISFSMNSNEFKTLVQIGKIEFKNGSYIDCHLITKKRIDKEGDIKIIGYEVDFVNQYYTDGTILETPEGKRHRHMKKNESKQLELFTDY